MGHGSAEGRRRVHPERHGAGSERRATGGAHQDSKVVDIGCGPGRLIIGLERIQPVSQYVGVDTHEPVITWAANNLAEPGIELRHVAIRNERYNAEGEQPTGPGFLPLSDGEFDGACLHSVFTHMLLPDISLYLAELHRVLRPGGRAYVSAFVEDDVPDETENPDDDGGPWSGPLHCVRLNRAVFEHHVVDAGLIVADLDHRPTHQSFYGLLRS